MSKRVVVALMTLICLTSPSKTGGTLTLTEGAAWSTLPIPVCFEDPKTQHRQDRDHIRKSIEQSWAKESAVTFEGWGACHDGSEGIRILLSRGYPKTIARGRHLNGLSAGMQLPELWGLTSLSINSKTTVHEFGHALGFGHEHARPDAPYEDACGVIDAAGKRYTEGDLAITAFDFDSIMVGCVKDATQVFSTGVPKLSAADIYGLVSTYGSAPANILDHDEPGDLFGQSIAIGDFDGDNVPDLAVGAPGEVVDGLETRRGAVYLFKGDDFRGLRPWGRLVPRDLPTENGMGMDGFGYALNVRKSTSTSRTSLVVGTADGSDFVFEGRSRMLPALSEDPTITVTTEAASNAADRLSLDMDAAADAARTVAPFDVEGSIDQIGFGAASALVDLDRDGHADLIVTAPKARSGEAVSGQVFVYRSADNDQPRKKPSAAFLPWYRFGQAY
ncbi:MAG: hypothetical protein ACR2Q4_00690 [Geminicoccaceae bacterium]